MISLHTVLVVTLVSQATTTMVLFLFAWSDRRSRGLVQLACACAIHTAAIALQPLWRGKGLWLPEAIAMSLLPLMFFLFHTGLRSFFGLRARWPVMEKVLLGMAMLVIFAMAPFHPLWPAQLRIAAVAACVPLCVNIRALWRAGTGTVRLHARITAGLLFGILACFLLRFPLEAIKNSSNLMIVLRELTMVGITMLAFSFLALYLAETSRRLHRETRMDALTGLPNRRSMEEIAEGQVKVSERKGTALALLMMDLDAFKLLNDTWGHAVGDRALRTVGKVLLAATQDSRNTAARLGGEEFAILLPDHTLDAAQDVAERLRAAIAGVEVVVEGGGHLSFTVSIGVAVWQPGETHWNPMLHRADSALYRAKREGRNRVELCEEALEQVGYGRLKAAAEEACVGAD